MKAEPARVGAATRTLVVVVATATAVAVIGSVLSLFGPRGAVFAFVVVWAPMTWMGTISRVVQPRLPNRYHELRAFERDGRLYEALGVRAAKWVLRRGPIAVFNPRLHLPRERTPERLAELDARMRDAEASHAILFVATCLVAVHAAVRGWWSAAALTTVFNLVMNGYPVILQRYNRGRLQDRFPTLADDGSPPVRT